MVLEYAQQARDHTFHRSPPVLRGANDFGFHIRGLSVMHFAQRTPSMMLTDAADVVNLTDFSRKNGLRPAPSSPSFAELVDALRNFKEFGRSFYNAETVDAALRFVENFGGDGVPDEDTTRRLVLWVDMKFGRFRGLILLGGLADGVQVKGELNMHDALLSKLLYDQQQTKLADLMAKFDARITNSRKVSPGRSDRVRPGGSIPKSVVSSLPKQGDKELCMKHLSKAGCSGGSEKCFNTKRAHFRPKRLPTNVKAHIEKAYGELAPDFADL
jgi:hypothetical protein